MKTRTVIRFQWRTATILSISRLNIILRSWFMYEMGEYVNSTTSGCWGLHKVPLVDIKKKLPRTIFHTCFWGTIILNYICIFDLIQISYVSYLVYHISAYVPGLCSSGLHDPIRYIYLMKKTVFKKNNVRLDILLLSLMHILSIIPKQMQWSKRILNIHPRVLNSKLPLKVSVCDYFQF